jgi:cytochrome c biogenesis protein CcdA
VLKTISKKIEDYLSPSNIIVLVVAILGYSALSQSQLIEIIIVAIIIIIGFEVVKFVALKLLELGSFIIRLILNPKRELKKIILYAMEEKTISKRFKSGDALTSETMNEIFYRLEELEKKVK